MKNLLLALPLLAACTQAPEPIQDYDAPLPGKGIVLETPAPAPISAPYVRCPVKSPYPWRTVRPGHEDALCWPDTPPQSRPEPEPEPEPEICQST